MIKNYLQPTVKLLNSTSSDLGFYLWLKSRQWIIRDQNDSSFMLDVSVDNVNLDEFYDSLPSRFYVGNELIDKSNYQGRIEKLGLQYLNFDQYIFEIQGSCLFRDILFNINKISQWSQSNRFLFSILKESERLDSYYYPISAEYENIKEWEDQFDIYMEAIKNDPIVDNNRLEMPYSISGLYWVSLNKKTLIELLSLLKYNMPFFYEVYGTQMLSQSGLDPNLIPTSLPPAMGQYYLYSNGGFEESTDLLNGTYNINIKMGLILYSQFLRQADTRISGLFNLVSHSDPEEFKTKVYKGGTVFNVNYVASKLKVDSTISTRLCAFAMSSGNSPCSWNYFIDRLLPSKFGADELDKLLPCTRLDDRIIDCKHYDDVKFRNEGLELSNCPCPLISRSMKDAENKKLRDNNRIGDAYYDLTYKLLNNYFNTTISINAFTSNLSVYTNLRGEEVEKFKAFANMILENIDTHCNTFKGHNSFDKVIPNELLELIDYPDPICVIKGYVIDKLSDLLELKFYQTSYIINFGGDILIRNASITVPIENTDFQLNLNGSYCVFTSGNTSKRGNHIKGENVPSNAFNTIVIDLNRSADLNYIASYADILSTKIFANNLNSDLELILSNLTYKLFKFKESGELENSAYCASPFFNKDDIKIRDAMLLGIANPVRPDLMSNSIKFEHGEATAMDVFMDNLDGISRSEVLVFPSRTTDVGTLFEIGRAYRFGKPIIRYDELTHTYTIVADSELNLFEVSLEPLVSDHMLFDCNLRSEVVCMGVVSGLVTNNAANMHYSLNGSRDNIMLSANFNRVELEGDQYVSYKRDIKAKDTEDNNQYTKEVSEIQKFRKIKLRESLLYRLFNDSKNLKVITSVS